MSTGHLSRFAIPVLVLVSLCALVAFSNVEEATTADPHDITLDEALHLIDNYQQTMEPGSRKGGFFQSEAVLRILAQEECVGMRYYYAMNDDGTRCLVLVGVDEHGEDMMYGELAEKSFPCPPLCSDAETLALR